MQITPNTDKFNVITESFYKGSNKATKALCVPIVLADIAINIVRNPIELTENIAFAFLNLIGAMYSTEYSIKDGFTCLHSVLDNTYEGIWEIFKIPYNFIGQIYSIFKDPSNINPITITAVNKRNEERAIERARLAATNS